MKNGDLVKYIGGAVLFMYPGDPTRQPSGLGVVVRIRRDGRWNFPAAYIYWPLEEIYFWHDTAELEIINE